MGEQKVAGGGLFASKTNCRKIVYFDLPNKRTCAFIYFYEKNFTCGGLLDTVRLLFFDKKSIACAFI